MFKSYTKPKPPIQSIQTVPATPEEQQQIKTVRANLEPLVATTPDDAAFLTDSTVVRYLRARNHSPTLAAEMLANTLKFRRTRTLVPCEHCAARPRSHSFYPIGAIAPVTADAKPTHADVSPLMYSNFDVQDRRTASVVQHMLWCMEELFDNHSLHQMIWVMDFHAFSRADMSPSNAKHVLSLFADHYPERLGNAVIYDAPYVFQSLWAAVKMIAAPETVRKVVFVKHDRKERRLKFDALGIRGQVLDRLCQEIDEARDGEIQPTKNWWTTAPLAPIPHYGLKLQQAGLAKMP